MEGIVISSLTYKMSCSPTPVPQGNTGGGELCKDYLQEQIDPVEGKTYKEYLQGLILPFHYSSPLTQFTNTASSQVYSLYTSSTIVAAHQCA